MRSPNFEIYSSAGQGSTRETLQHFELVRSFFQQTLGDSSKDQQPVHIVVFGSRKEYALYSSYIWSVGSYHQSAERDIIVLGDPSPETFPTAVHEYFHLWAGRQKLDLPIWLNEGLAELYATLKPTFGGQIVGDVPPEFGRYVSRYDWIPLRTIVSAREYPHSNKDGEVNDFYLESWALTHMLELGGDYRGGAPKILPAIQSGMSSEEALTKIYGKPLSAIEVDLRAYLLNIASRHEVYSAKLPKSPKSTAIEPAPEFDRRLVLVQLLNRQDRADEVHKELAALVALDPKRPEPHAELGSLAAFRGDAAAARDEYRLAFDLGGLGPNLLWDYGRMLVDTPAEAIKVFGRLLHLDSSRIDARLELARGQLAAKQASSALGTLAVIHDPGKADAADFFQLLAEANLEAGRRQESAKAARDWVLAAQDEVEKSEAGRFLAGLENGQADGKPALQRRSVEGRLIGVDCRNRGMTLTVETAAGNRAFAARDSGRVTVVGKDGGFAVIACGAQQKPAPVRIEYARPLTDGPGANGVVKLIEFVR